MLFSADQLVAHAIGDYIFQSSNTAVGGRSEWRRVLTRAATYTIPFLFLTTSILQLGLIFAAYAGMARYDLVRYLVWLKSGPLTNIRREGFRIRADLAPITQTGYPGDTPHDAPLSVSAWQGVITGAILQVFVNAIILAYVP